MQTVAISSLPAGLRTKDLLRICKEGETNSENLAASTNLAKAEVDAQSFAEATKYVSDYEYYHAWHHCTEHKLFLSKYKKCFSFHP